MNFKYTVIWVIFIFSHHITCDERMKGCAMNSLLAVDQEENVMVENGNGVLWLQVFSNQNNLVN